MTSAAHFVAGAAICRYVPSRPIGLALAFASHFLLDAIPHWEDPGLLARWLGPGAGDVWHIVPPVSRVVVVIAAVAIWWRFGRRDGLWTIAYLIAGGVLGLLPDTLTTLLGRQSLMGAANHGAHWWIELYRALRERPGWPPAIFVTCVSLELATMGIAAWALFRPVRRADDD